jgi:hypothetical protein
MKIMERIFIKLISTAILSCLFFAGRAQAPAPQSYYPSVGQIHAIATPIFIGFDRTIRIGSGTWAFYDYDTDELVYSVDHTSEHLSTDYPTLVFRGLFDFALEYNKHYYVLISPGLVESEDGAPFEGISDKNTFHFYSNPEQFGFSVQHYTPKTRYHFDTEFTVRLAVEEYIVAGSGNFHLRNQSTQQIVASVPGNSADVTFERNTISIDFDLELEDKVTYGLGWDAGAFQTVNLGNQATENDWGLNILVYTSKAPDFQNDQTSLWPWDDYGAWEPEGDWFSVSYDRPILKGSGKFRIHEYHTNTVVEEIDASSTAMFVSGINDYPQYLNIVPSIEFTPGMRYYVTYDAGLVTDKSGQPVAALTDKDFWTFTIDGQLPLEVVSKSPTGDVIYPWHLELEFNRPVSQVSITNAIQLRRVDNDALVHDLSNGFVTYDGNKVLIRVNGILPKNMEVYVYIAPGVFEDEFENAFAGFTSSMDWRILANWEDLEITSHSPAVGSDWFPAQNGEMRMAFNRPVSLREGATGTVNIRKYNAGEGFPFVAQISPGDPRLQIENGEFVIKFDDFQLEYGVTYFMTWPNGIVVDSDGVPNKTYNSTSDYWVIVEPDPELFAQIQSLSPAIGATGIELDAPLQIQFTNTVTLNPSYFVSIYEKANDNFIMSFDIGANSTLVGNLLTITPTENLPANTEVYVQIQNFAIHSMDYSAFTLSGPDGWYFTTGGATVQDQAITFEALSAKTYGDANFNLSATASSGLTVTFHSSNTNVATVAGNTVTIVGAGSTTITASQAGNEHFNAASNVERTLTVNKAPLTVTADNKSMTYGASVPSLTIQYSGFVLSENAGSLTTVPSAGTVATSSSNAGAYAITVSGGVSSNYEFNYVNGTLTINKATALVELSNMEQEADGSPKSPTVTTDPAGLTYTLTFNGSATVPSSPGSYAVVATINETNYEGSASGTFDITGDPLGLENVWQLKVYPNPATDFVTVQSISKLSVTFFDVSGAQKLQTESGQLIDLRTLSTGIYILQLRDSQGRTEQQRIIKR